MRSNTGENVLCPRIYLAHDADLVIPLLYTRLRNTDGVDPVIPASFRRKSLLKNVFTILTYNQRLAVDSNFGRISWVAPGVRYRVVGRCIVDQP